MHLTYHCPHCEHTNQSPNVAEISVLGCSHCDWSRPFSDDSGRLTETPTECLRCGNPDLWRQKNFPQSLGLLFVAVGAISSSIAWSYYQPILALGILMGFALLDMLLYIVMPDVLVCYRCRTKHHQANTSRHSPFDHELGEKYRQEEIRKKTARPTGEVLPHATFRDN